MWRRSNWHWYMKFERKWGNCGKLIQIKWDSELPLKLNVFIQLEDSVQHLVSRFSIDFQVSPNGTVAVIDGRHAMLTPLRYTKYE